MGEYYSAKEAAAVLQLKYTTLLSRARRGEYRFVKIGWAILFPKKHIDEKAAKDGSANENMETATR